MDRTLFLNQPNCPGGDLLSQFVAGQLDESQDVEIETHVEDCLACQAYLDMVSRGEPNILQLRQGKTATSPGSIYQKPEIDGFEILDYCKSGGQGVIFKARETALDRLVAIKLLKNDYQRQARREKGVVSEAMAIAQLSHPHIVKLHSLAWTAQGPAMIMDWVEGESLADWLNQHKCNQAEAAQLLIKICDAVATAHQAGILHRDIKPSNILLRQSDLNQPMLCDFGLAKLKRANGDYSTATIGVGTAGYMPPEMIVSRFGKITAAADIYSMGALLYQLLTGHLPHESNSVYETLELTCEKDVLRPTFFEKGIHRDLETICLKCMQREPERRYESVMELKSDLEKFLAERPVAARRAGSIQKLRRLGLEHPWVATLAASLFGVLLAGVIVLSYALNRALAVERRLEQELTRSTKILRLSTPLLKNYMSLGVLKKDELEKVQSLSKLFNDLESDSSSLRQRFDLIYVGLQLAHGLMNVKGQEQLALAMTRQSRLEMKRLIDENRQALDMQAVLMDGDKIGISLLDQSLVYYGHCCIQLCSIIRLIEGNKGWDDANRYLNEAIETVEAVIAKNPEMSEPYTDLASCYAIKTDLYSGQRDERVTRELPIKAESLHAKMKDLHPDAPEKMNYWLLSVQQILRLNPEVDSGKVDMGRIMREVHREMARVRSQNETMWKLTAEAFSNVILLDSRSAFGQNKPHEAQVKLLSLHKIWQELTAEKSPLPIHIRAYVITGIETIAALGADLARQKEAVALFEELERFLERRPEDALKRLLLATLYLRCPMAPPRSVATAADLVKTLDQADAEVQYLNGLVSLQANPDFVPATKAETLPPEWQNALLVRRMESLLDHQRANEALSILAKQEPELSRHATVTLDDQNRLARIRKRIGQSIR